MQEYIITAHSAVANTTQREINLLTSQLQVSLDAQRHADSFAMRLNEQRFLNTTDWQGRIEPVGLHIRTQ
jgi:hypothetical protein